MKPLQTSFALSAIGIVLTLAAHRYADIPLALILQGNVRKLNALGQGLGSAVLISGELLVMAVLVAVRLTTGGLSPFGKAVLIAGSASLIAFAVNDAVLKVLFGLANPNQFLFYHADHHLHPFQGRQDSSFPSGHMALATGFATALGRLSPRFRIPLSILLWIAAGALVLGDWHFLSDVIAGTIVGGLAGVVAVELWTQHVRRVSDF